MEVLGFQSFLQSDDVHFFFVRAKKKRRWLASRVRVSYRLHCLFALPFLFCVVEGACGDAVLSAFPTACDDEPILLILVFIVFEGACGGTGLPEFPTACHDE